MDLAQPVTAAAAATVTGANIITDAAAAAGDSLLDSGAALIVAHPYGAAILFALAMLRAALPWLRSKAGATANKWDDRAVAFLSWCLFGVKARPDKVADAADGRR